MYCQLFPEIHLRKIPLHIHICNSNTLFQTVMFFIRSRSKYFMLVVFVFMWLFVVGKCVKEVVCVCVCVYVYVFVCGDLLACDTMHVLIKLKPYDRGK